jgi:hypothetical protein
VLSEKKGDEQTLAEIKKALDEENWAELSMKLGVKVIHISERDTQISSKPKQFNEFVNTWSPEGFFEEGIISILDNHHIQIYIFDIDMMTSCCHHMKLTEITRILFITEIIPE